MRDLIVKIALKLGIYKKLVDIDTFFIDRRKSKNFKKYGEEAYIKMDDVCRSLGVQLLPIFGTQLGFIRENGFIPYDNDIDTAIVYNQRPDNLIEALEENGFILETVYYIKGEDKNLIEQYSYKGVHVDIFYLFDYSEEDYFCYIVERHETLNWKEANRTNGFPCHLRPFKKGRIVEKVIFNHKFFIPEKSDEWLRDIYGDSYMTPIKNFVLKEFTDRYIFSDIRLYRKQYV